MRWWQRLWHRPAPAPRQNTLAESVVMFDTGRTQDDPDREAATRRRDDLHRRIMALETDLVHHSHEKDARS
jgi:hypothetical protein